MVLAICCAGVGILGAIVARRADGDLRRWREAHLPMLAAMLCGTIGSLADPLSRSLLYKNAPPVIAAGSHHLWSVLGLPIAAVAIAIGVSLLRGARPVASHAWIAGCVGIFACGIALAGRLSLMEGQLLMLGGFALAWWRTQAIGGTACRWSLPLTVLAYALVMVACVVLVVAKPSPIASVGSVAIAFVAIVLWLCLSGRASTAARPMSADQMGPEAWTAMGVLLLGLGGMTVSRVVVMGFAQARVVAQWSGADAILVAADVLSSGPYLGGLMTQAPEALMMLAIAALVGVAVSQQRGSRPLGAACVLLGLASAAYRLTAMWAALPSG